MGLLAVYYNGSLYLVVNPGSEEQILVRIVSQYELGKLGGHLGLEKRTKAPVGAVIGGVELNDAAYGSWVIILL